MSPKTVILFCFYHIRTCNVNAKHILKQHIYRHATFWKWTEIINLLDSIYFTSKWLIGEYFETGIWLIHFFIGICSIKWFILKLNETRHFVLIRYAKLCSLQVKINSKWCIPQDFLTKFGNGGHSGAFENIPYMLNTNAK